MSLAHFVPTLQPSVLTAVSDAFSLPTKEELKNYIYEDYWELFVLKHQQLHNIVFHMAGVILFYGIPLTAIFTQQIWVLFLMPISPSIGLIGHALFERSNIDLQDAVFSARTVRCFNKMFYRVLIGKYSKDIQIMNARLLYQVKKRLIHPNDQKPPISSNVHPI